MEKFQIQLAVMLAVFANCVDEFNDVDYLDFTVEDDPFDNISTQNLDREVLRNAEIVCKTVKALIWEVIFCGVPDVSNVQVEIKTNSYKKVVEISKEIVGNGEHTKWTPELHDLIETKISEIYSELIDMLTETVRSLFVHMKV